MFASHIYLAMCEACFAGKVEVVKWIYARLMLPRPREWSDEAVDAAFPSHTPPFGLAVGGNRAAVARWFAETPGVRGFFRVDPPRRLYEDVISLNNLAALRFLVENFSPDCGRILSERPELFLRVVAESGREEIAEYLSRLCGVVPLRDRVGLREVPAASFWLAPAPPSERNPVFGEMPVCPTKEICARFPSVPPWLRAGQL